MVVKRNDIGSTVAMRDLLDVVLVFSLAAFIAWPPILLVIRFARPRWMP